MVFPAREGGGCGAGCGCDVSVDVDVDVDGDAHQKNLPKLIGAVGILTSLHDLSVRSPRTALQRTCGRGAI